VLKFRFVILSVALQCIAGLIILRVSDTASAQQSNSLIPRTAQTSSGKNSADSIKSLLESVREEYKLPAIAASVVSSDGGIVSAASGMRIKGNQTQVTARDEFSIGSVSKPMTATVIATLVEDGKLLWTTRVLDVFPELKELTHPTLREITLEQLLSHRAGIAPFEEDKDIESIPKFPGNAREQRYAFTRWLLKPAAVVAPGTKKVYSNAGYGIAAAMAERVTGKSFETLMRQRLFKPLGMKSAGFGWPAKTDTKQPWGHRASASGFVPHNPKDSYQIPAFMLPAGDVHCNMEDLAKFAAFHLRGLSGQNSILRAETIKKLHTPYGGSKSGSALGWNVNSYGHSHFGGTGTFSAVLVIFPKENLAVAVAMNASGEKDDEIETKIVDALLEQYKAQ
jgi:CubicO group peptidase (beta-lactamase class C family)